MSETKLAESMGHAGVSQGALAKWLGIHPSVVQLWASGRRHMPERWAQPVADYLEIEPEALLCDAEETWEQAPLAFMWRQVCLLCGRERWLRLPMTDAQQLRQSHCPQCQGFRLLELDQGIQRPHDVEYAA